MVELPPIIYSATIEDDKNFYYEVEMFEDFTYINYFEKENEEYKMIKEVQLPTNYAKQIANCIIALGKQFP